MTTRKRKLSIERLEERLPMTASPPFTLLKDINATPYNSSGDLGELLAVGNTLYIVANDGTHGSELWKSDGTGAGTVLLKDIYQGVQYVVPHGLRNVNGTLYFQMGNNQIWKTDGTEDGTVQIVDMQVKVFGVVLGRL